MSKRTRQRRQDSRNSRDAPNQSVGLCSLKGWEVLINEGYKPLSQCPEVQMCASVYADLISIMTIHLLENTGKGDKRVKNELSRRVDISPSPVMTRTPWMDLQVKQLLLTGNQVTVPLYRDGYLEELKPLAMDSVSFEPTRTSYQVRYGDQVLKSDEVLNFVLNPDPQRPWEGHGFSVQLKDVVKSIRQTSAAKATLMQNPGPSIIVKVDGLTEEFSSTEGRKVLREQYWDATDANEPWFIPAEAFSVEQIRPLTLNDLAIKDSLELDKRSIAAIMGVPAYFVGVGEFKRDEYNFFLSSRVKKIAETIEQELTRGTLINPDWHWAFNVRTLYSYSPQELRSIGESMVRNMSMRRNEWREMMNFPPDPEMDELLALENFIPADRLGDQKKLKGGGSDGENEGNEADKDGQE